MFLGLALKKFNTAYISSSEATSKAELFYILKDREREKKKC